MKKEYYIIRLSCNFVCFFFIINNIARIMPLYKPSFELSESRLASVSIRDSYGSSETFVSVSRERPRVASNDAKTTKIFRVAADANPSCLLYTKPSIKARCVPLTYPRDHRARASRFVLSIQSSRGGRTARRIPPFETFVEIPSDAQNTSAR